MKRHPGSFSDQHPVFQSLTLPSFRGKNAVFHSLTARASALAVAGANALFSFSKDTSLRCLLLHPVACLITCTPNRSFSYIMPQQFLIETLHPSIRNCCTFQEMLSPDPPCPAGGNGPPASSCSSQATSSGFFSLTSARRRVSCLSPSSGISAMTLPPLTSRPNRTSPASRSSSASRRSFCRGRAPRAGS